MVSHGSKLQAGVGRPGYNAPSHGQSMPFLCSVFCALYAQLCYKLADTNYAQYDLPDSLIKHL